MQTPFMVSQALDGNNELEEDIACRIVANTAYGFWEDKSWVLMMTSVFSPVLAQDREDLRLNQGGCSGRTQ